jgi:hypothetical protein
MRVWTDMKLMRRCLGLLVLLPCESWRSLADDLVLAAANGDATVVSNLLSDGVAVDATNKEGTTALLSAAIRGQAAMVRLLAKAGANVDVQGTISRFDSQGRRSELKDWSALAFAADCANERDAVNDFARSEWSAVAGLSLAVSLPCVNGLDTVAALLEAGANPFIEDFNGYNALMRAHSGSKHHALIEARVHQLGCVVATGDKCSDKEIAFAAKWKSKTVEEVDAEASRLNMYLKKAMSYTSEKKLRKWLQQRLSALSQIRKNTRHPSRHHDVNHDEL